MHSNVKSIVTLLMLNIVLVINSTNPVSFTYDNNVEYKGCATVGNILIDNISDSLLDSLLSGTAQFRIILSLNEKGDILSISNVSRGISDKIVSKFVESLKKNNTELYIYIQAPSPISKNKQDYINSIKYYKFPHNVYFFFPGKLLYHDPLFDNYLKGKELKLDKPMPSRAEIKKTLNKHKNIRLKTSRDFGVTEKDYFNTNNIIYPINNQ